MGGAPALPPMPGMGGAPAGPPGIPPMPGAQRPSVTGVPPLGSKMPPISSVPQGPQRADQLLTGIMVGMQQFEAIAPKFMQMMQAPPPGLSPQEQHISAAFTAEIEGFYADMYNYMQAMDKLLEK